MATQWALVWAGLAVVALAAPARALSVSDGRRPLRQPRGIDVTTALLLEYYQQLPERREGESSKAWATRLDDGLKKFKANVSGRYSEGTLQRLADHPSSQTRRAALLALHHIGTMASNEALAARLRDEELQVRQMAADALWAVWFRADTEANNKELQTALQQTDPKKGVAALTALIRKAPGQTALQQTDPKKGVAALTALIRKAPGFAEAYNQRAILYFQAAEYDKCAADCEKALELNKQHFGAAAGLGRCYLRLRLPQPALKAFRTAYEINPNLEGVQDAIRDLESILRGEGK
jgi:tetratricopeptide (TPR) repeat protein